jgi:hypothetical protein
MRPARGEIKRQLVSLFLIRFTFLFLILMLPWFNLYGQLTEEARNGLTYARVSATGRWTGIDGRLLRRHFSASTRIGIIAGVQLLLLLLLLLKSTKERGVHVGDLQLLSSRCRSRAIRDL